MTVWATPTRVGSTFLIKGPFETKEKYRNFGGFQFYREITYVALEERI
jgi:hypothetical protein